MYHGPFRYDDSSRVCGDRGFSLAVAGTTGDQSSIKPTLRRPAPECNPQEETNAQQPCARSHAYLAAGMPIKQK